MWLPVLLNLFALWLITILRKPKVKACKLDVLVGHPEHYLLFIATQVARSVGLKNPSNAVSSFRTHNGDVRGLIQFREVLAAYHSLGDHRDANGVYQQLVGRPNSSVIQVNSWMGTESWVYQMLMRGDLKSANDFRNWIAEDVAPTIRKTGQYNAAESSDPIAVGIMSVARSYVDSTSLAGV
ncbi:MULTISPECIES: BRO family protein [Pseudomonas]|uniref:BRO family protein n=1 Tax=Pseudomonas TaxID=286 RepID=UPI00147F935A|nr:BRO family protein [Pseudomonas monteilii]